ncbi:DUF2971 domain-containing protein [Marinomonas sp. GJ51-6]|uniref:DUF2971 domain-containing protein n=1 Tax=Marinomonas sp. GJ51-6 TaxID=2992802 RepID=UPI002935058A|nr:DUF2971 domain-containing protein [Marinomonas sp. GJ51-6]WOD08490.1 DUF2971 domain-containing protein [Marinomonas sp. GJ51-6]
MIIYKNFSKSIVDLILKPEGINIRISQIEVLNDPLEFSGSWDKLHQEEKESIKEILKSENKDINFEEAKIEEMLESALSDLPKEASKYITDLKQKLGRSSYGIISFSESSKSIPMWAYYSENHTGFSLAFDRNKIEETVEKKSI